MLDGREPPKHCVLRRPVTPSAVYTANVTDVELRIDDQATMSCPPMHLARTLSKLRREDVLLILSNSAQRNIAQVSETYRLSFRVADAVILQKVEQAFCEIITPSTLTLSTIQSFLDDPRCGEEGAEYAEALGRFALGILRKEDPDCARLTTASGLYRDDYVMAEQGLRELERPLARLVAQLARFALNDFSAEPVETGFWDLDLAYRLLQDPECAAFPTSPQDAEERRPICPVDHDTGRILNLAVRMCSQERWSPLLSTECRLIARSEKLDAVDQQKAAAIWAACAWRLGARQEAAEPLRMIAATYPFHNWAARFLEEPMQ